MDEQIALSESAKAGLADSQSWDIKGGEIQIVICICKISLILCQLIGTNWNIRNNWKIVQIVLICWINQFIFKVEEVYSWKINVIIYVSVITILLCDP